MVVAGVFLFTVVAEMVNAVFLCAAVCGVVAVLAVVDVLFSFAVVLVVAAVAAKVYVVFLCVVVLGVVAVTAVVTAVFLFA